ncbi:hypothetical protein [Gaoshiqia sp. Z1-71]|uniref:ParM/StbA family protein n=1 Tax=Gaoshiqia hydrogeniformans TaxID=3290090 RepID=UPI003BF8F59B
MKSTISFPSVFEENYRNYEQVANNFLQGIRILDFKGKDYIVGEFALNEGNAPHKFLNSSVQETDYQLLGLTGLLLATQGAYSNLILTTGFPFTTYLPFKQAAQDFFSGTHKISYDSRLLGENGVETIEFSIPQVDVLTEIEGCIKTIREGNLKEKDNFFIASLGYGTFELALSTPSGIIHRTTYSSRGISYAVNLLENELQKHYYLNLPSEKQLEQAFQRGSIIINRSVVDLKAVRQKILHSYYTEILSPVIRKRFSDDDFMKAKKFYLAGGGALYDELVNYFRDEFKDVLDVIVLPEPNLAASKGYCLHACEMAEKLTDQLEDKSSYACVGLDIGNSNTVITVNNL